MSQLMLDLAGRRRSPATMPGSMPRTCPATKRTATPADPPKSKTSSQSCARQATGPTANGCALIVILWRAGLRINEALELTEGDLDESRGALLVRRGGRLALPEVEERARAAGRNRPTGVLGVHETPDHPHYRRARDCLRRRAGPGRLRAPHAAAREQRRRRSAYRRQRLRRRCPRCRSQPSHPRSEPTRGPRRPQPQPRPTASSRSSSADLPGQYQLHVLPPRRVLRFAPKEHRVEEALSAASTGPSGSPGPKRKRSERRRARIAAVAARSEPAATDLGSQL